MNVSRSFLLASCNVPALTDNHLFYFGNKHQIEQSLWHHYNMIVILHKRKEGFAWLYSLLKKWKLLCHVYDGLDRRLGILTEIRVKCQKYLEGLPACSRLMQDMCAFGIIEECRIQACGDKNLCTLGMCRDIRICDTVYFGKCGSSMPSIAGTSRHSLYFFEDFFDATKM